ncbi:6,7-dimethyl-8-ribityllumazine synthase [Naumannella huperziae]
MGTDVRYAGRVEPALDATGLRIAVACGRFNDHVTMRLLEGTRRELAGLGGEPAVEAWVPGAFELPFACRRLAVEHDAVIALGCVIRGDTAHFDHVAGQAAAGLMRVGLDTGVPVVFGVLTTENIDQALARSEGAGGHNVGAEAARTAVEMSRFGDRARVSAGGRSR